MNKPFAPSCERNQVAILDVLKSIIKSEDKHLLEIGSGTGQHAVFMAPHFSHLQWHTADVLENHEGIKAWLDDVQIDNIAQPIYYHSGKTAFPDIRADIVFTANTLHIMSWQHVQMLIRQLGKNLKTNAQVLIYGPFNYQGKFTSSSNADFDVWLKQQQTYSGIRDFEEIEKLMKKENIELLHDIEMPANNRILHFIKSKAHV